MSAERRFHIKVPSTSANIGPGFDVLGLSFPIYTTLTVHIGSPNVKASQPPVLSYTGEGASDAPLDPYKNLITRVALYVLRCHSIARFPSQTSIHVHNDIPFGRGLGSSGAAVIAGVLLADAIGQLKLSDSRKLDFALMVERHPDNVAAALLGGFVASYLKELNPEDTAASSIPLAEVLPEYPSDAGENWGLYPPIPPEGIGHFIRLRCSPDIRAVVVIPRFELSTAKSRDALPHQYTLKDCVFNLQRLAVLTTALGQSPPDSGLIFQAMQDRIHHPYRKHLIPALPEILSSITPSSQPGLLGICLSGAGPTVLVLATSNFEEIGQVVQKKWFELGEVESDWKVIDITTVGAQVDYDFDGIRTTSSTWVDRKRTDYV